MQGIGEPASVVVAVTVAACTGDCSEGDASLTMPITVTVNGESRPAEVEPRTLLVHYLRDHLGLTGTHVGCETSQCGACTVLLDGRAVKSCTVLAVQTDGAAVTTIEGLAPRG